MLIPSKTQVVTREVDWSQAYEVTGVYWTVRGSLDTTAMGVAAGLDVAGVDVLTESLAEVVEETAASPLLGRALSLAACKRSSLTAGRSVSDARRFISSISAVSIVSLLKVNSSCVSEGQ